MNAADALAELWRARRADKDERERALEIALASALTCEGAWSRLVALLQPPEASQNVGPALPPTEPEAIRRQVRRSARDRTDVELRFGDDWLVLELKFSDPPTKAQLRRYSEWSDVFAVVAVAATRPAFTAPKLAGAITWREIVEIPWPNAPLPWQQMCALVRAMGMLMPPVDHAAMRGLLASWEIPEQLEDWSERAAETVRHRMSRPAGPTFVLSESSRDTRRTSWHHRRLATRVWPSGWGGAPWACVFVGFYFGRHHDPVLDPEFPDLLLTWHTDHASPLGRALDSDPALRAGVDRWCARHTDETRREQWFRPGAWELIRARQSAQHVTAMTNPQAAFQSWVESILREWEDEGVVDAISNVLARQGTKVPAAGTTAPPLDPEPGTKS